MSSNSGTIINRANATAPFLNAIKSRNSKSLPELYSAEVNTEPMAQSRVEVESSSAAGYNRTMRISLPRYGLLNRLYLHTKFGAADYAESGTNAVQFVPFIGAFAYREIRLMYNGSVLAKLNPETIVSDLWKNSTTREKKHLQELLGAFKTASSSFANSGGRNSGTNANRQVVATGHDGLSDYYCPLDFFFSAKHSPNRALDLSVLANEVILEVDVEASSNIWKTDGTVTAIPTLDNVSAVCYLTEFDVETEKQYRSLQYQAGGSPLTQLAFDTTHVVVASNVSHSTNDTAIDIKLNQFTGQVYKLVVYATLTDNFATNRHRIVPGSIKEIQLKATGSNIYNSDELDKKEDLVESYHNGGDFISFNEDDDTYAVMSDCNPLNFYEINFKHPYDMSKVSASGSVALGQLSVPTLRVVVPGSAANAGFGGLQKVLAAAVDIHVVAYHTTLISYNTNTSGSTHIRQIMN